MGGTSALHTADGSTSRCSLPRCSSRQAWAMAVLQQPTVAPRLVRSHRRIREITISRKPDSAPATDGFVRFGSASTGDDAHAGQPPAIDGRGVTPGPTTPRAVEDPGYFWNRSGLRTRRSSAGTGSECSTLAPSLA